MGKGEEQLVVLALEVASWIGTLAWEAYLAWACRDCARSNAPCDVGCMEARASSRSGYEMKVDAKWFDRSTNW